MNPTTTVRAALSWLAIAGPSPWHRFQLGTALGLRPVFLLTGPNGRGGRAPLLRTDDLQRTWAYAFSQSGRQERAGWLAELRATRLRSQLGVELLAWAEHCGVGLVLDEGTPLRFAIPPEQVQAYRVAAEYTGIASARSLVAAEQLQRSA
jgi:hypothetical protein